MQVTNKIQKSNQMQANVLPETGFLRLHQILKLIPLSKSSWWSGVKSGKYPQSIKHGGATFWRVEDIKKLIAEISEN